MLLLGASLLLACGLAEILVHVAAGAWPNVKYLVAAGAGNSPRRFARLEDFLAAFPVHIAPHRIWNNYYTNALGFTDREFQVEKPAGTLRVMALGDSFLYGQVAYPQNVMTLVEQSLRHACANDGIEIMNFGVPGSSPSDYRELHALAAPIYKPDVVLVHFYMGNDGPDYDGPDSSWPSVLKTSYAWLTSRSYAWALLVNTIRTMRAVERSSSEPVPTGPPQSGGERASDNPELTDQDFGPTFNEATFASIAANEFGRLYAGKGTQPGSDRWQATIDLLDAIRMQAMAGGGRSPIIILYPSSVQVYPRLFEAAKQYVAKSYPNVDLADFDPAEPSRRLLAYCTSRGLACHDLTPALVAAAQENPEPLYIPRDSHWNIRGNRTAAAAEVQFLRGELCGAR